MLGTLGAGLSNFPWLSASILFPIGSAFVIPFFPDKGDGKEVRWFALSIALITFLITVGSYINGFDISNENVQLKENISWLPDLGLTWSVGADGISMPLIYEPTVIKKVINAIDNANHLTSFPSPLSGKKGITNALPIGNKIEADNQGKFDNPAPKVPNICVAKCV